MRKTDLTRLQKIRALLDKARRDTLVQDIGGQWYKEIEKRERRDERRFAPH